MLVDSEGSAFCVIEAVNSSSNDCGVLGELACQAPEAAGSSGPVAGCPLVRDQHQETAVQSPDGGTKVAWSGPPIVLRQEVIGSGSISP